MADYQDYGYTSAEASHTFFYLINGLTAMLDKNVNKHILDLGCGNGLLVNYLLKQGFNVYGTDASAKGIAIANQLNPGRFFVQDMETDTLPLELQNIGFDTIISTEVIEHLYNPVTFINFAERL